MTIEQTIAEAVRKQVSEREREKLFNNFSGRIVAILHKNHKTKIFDFF